MDGLPWEIKKRVDGGSDSALCSLMARNQDRYLNRRTVNGISIAVKADAEYSFDDLCKNLDVLKKDKPKVKWDFSSYPKVVQEVARAKGISIT